MRRCLHVPMFSHFSRTPACDRHRAIAYTAQNIAHVVKTQSSDVVNEHTHTLVDSLGSRCMMLAASFVLFLYS